MTDLEYEDSSPVASLILETVAAEGGWGRTALTINDAGAEVSRVAQSAGCEVFAWYDDARDSPALAGFPSETDRADVVCWLLPRDLDSIDELANRIAALQPRLVVAAARVKHMTPTMNPVLGRYFGEVRATLGRRKSRALVLRQPHPQPSSWPKRGQAAGLDIVAYAGVFAGRRLDPGTALLLPHLPAPAPDRERAVDFGCGSGVIACTLSRMGWRVLATDTSRAAVASTRATAVANGLDLDVVWADGLPAIDPPPSLIAANPPFHRGAAKDSAATFAMIEAARLAPGGELWLVYNAHLPYLPALRRHVGTTSIVARDREYLVTRSIAR